jgi:hypothetical protein
VESGIEEAGKTTISTVADAARDDVVDAILKWISARVLGPVE